MKRKYEPKYSQRRNEGLEGCNEAFAMSPAIGRVKALRDIFEQPPEDDCSDLLPKGSLDLSGSYRKRWNF